VCKTHNVEKTVIRKIGKRITHYIQGGKKMSLVKGLGSVAALVGKVLVVGTQTVVGNALHSSQKELSNNISRDVSAGYNHYAKPRLQKGMSLIRGKKDQI
jgi:hypothetical protein